MSTGRVIAALVAIILGVLVVYIARNTYWDDVMLPAPLRGEAATNPFYAAEKFVKELGSTAEVRQTLGALTERTDVLVLSNWYWDLIEDRRQQVITWVEAGGHVLVDRTLLNDEGFMDWSGVRREYREPDTDLDDAANGGEAAEQANTDAPEFADMCASIEEVDATGTVRPDGRTLSVCQLDRFSSLTTDRDIAWGFASDDALQAVRVRVGRGWVTVVNARPFGNRNFAEADNGKLFAAAARLHRGDHIVFVSEHEQLSLLALIWLHGAPVVVLGSLVLAALLWRGGVRFGPLAAATDTARRSLAEQIRGTGRFALRLGDGKALHAATVRALQEAAARRIVRYRALPHEERIAAIAQRARLDQETLTTAINHTGARRSAELAHTIALLETARRRLLE
jgi:hypothetical protein